MKTNPMKKNILSFSAHLGIFILIEIFFVFIILREFPSISLLGTVGIIHTIYWIIVIIAGILRVKIKPYWWKFLATYIPVVLHIIGHIYIILLTVETVVQEDAAHAHDEHSITWIIISTITLWIFIFIWEWLLHRKQHCDTCHGETHKHCVENNIN